MKTSWMFVAAAVLLLTACEKARLDQQVRELCATDGGIKVYETVVLSADKFDARGMVVFYNPTLEENSLGPEYIYKRMTEDLKTGKPDLRRTHYQIFRRADKKILGETVLYSRRGGDMPGPWHDSHFSCPDPNEAGSVVLIKRIFINK